MARFVSTMVFGACVWCLACGLLARPATADPANKNSTVEPTRIALVDIARVFKTSKIFAQKRDALQAQISESEEVAKKTQDKLQQMAQRLMKLEQGTDEFKELETRLKKESAEFQEFRKAKSNEFMTAESVIYLDIYKVAENEVAAYAQSRGIDLVLKHNAEPLKFENPKQAMQSINRLVVYENKLEITDEIIASMAER